MPKPPPPRRPSCSIRLGHCLRQDAGEGKEFESRKWTWGEESAMEGLGQRAALEREPVGAKRLGRYVVGGFLLLAVLAAVILHLSGMTPWE